MRWQVEEKTISNIRIVKRFLLFPKVINGVARWMELAKIKQTFTSTWDGAYWEDTEWMD